tara:strand:+ start:2406 stop:3482 length:1077 start_codon:yes stop_codon:yes gene_type:complete
MKPINICFITQIYNENDPYRSNVVEWIRNISLNSNVNHVHVLTRYKSKSIVGNKCTISSIENRFKLVSLILFYIEILKQVSRKSIIFIHMGGPYAINLVLFKIFFKTKVYQWWAHPVIGISTRLGFYLTVDKLFTCTEKSFPIASTKKIVVGHGVNIKKFPIRNETKPNKKALVTASRLTYRKNIHKMINLIEFMHEKNMSDISLHIYGSPLNYKDKLYEEYLNLLIEKSNLQNHIKIYEAVDHSDLNKYYKKYNLYLNFSETALDKSVLEAMSTGIPILSCNECVEEIIDDENLKNLITFNKSDNLSLISDKVSRLINFSREEFDEYAFKSNQFIKNNHSIENLINSIVENIISLNS